MQLRKEKIMRTKFENQLKELNEDLISLGAECEDCLTYAMQALVTGEKEIANMAMECECETDKKQREIQELCMRILQQQQPVASDLRAVSAALRMIVDLERIADQGSDIAEISRQIGFEKNRHNKSVVKMADITIKMLSAAVTSFVNRDVNLAEAVEKMDDDVDALFHKAKLGLIDLMSSSTKIGREDAEQALEVMMIAKYFERIGDHTVNIAEAVVSMLKGIVPT